MILRCLPFYLLACLLAACAGPASTSGPQACDLRKVAEVPLNIEQGHISVPATVEDKPVAMLVDTGADRTMVTPAAVAALSLQRDRRARTIIRGTGGTVVSQNARLQSFGIGGLEMLDQSYAVGELPVLSGPGFHASGLIGADWLGDFDVDLDLPRRRMTLYRGGECGAGDLPWQGPRTEVRTVKLGVNLVLVKVALDGTPVTAILDSGANASVVSATAAARAGVTAAVLGADERTRSMGADGTMTFQHLHRFGTLDVGTDRSPDARIAVGTLRTPPPAEMLLGLDWLRTHRVWIDDRDHKLFIQRAGSA